MLVDFGFRFDSFLGNDWQFSKDYGLFDRAFKPNSFAGVDLPQMFVEAHLPVLTNLGLLLRFGRFYSPSGFESVMATKRPLLSVPYLFNFTPFTYLGFQSILHVNPQLNLINSVVNGDDRWFDERYHYSYNGGFNWTSKNGATSLASYVLVGPGQLPTFPPLNTPILPLGVPQSPPSLAGKPNHALCPPPADLLRRHRDPQMERPAHSGIRGVLHHRHRRRLADRERSSARQAGTAPRTGSCTPSTPIRNTPGSGVPRSSRIARERPPASPRTYYEQTLGLIYKPKPWLWVRPRRGMTGHRAPSRSATARGAASSRWRSTSSCSFDSAVFVGPWHDVPG